MSLDQDPSLLDEHYGVIGAAVVSFGYLEHEVMRAAIALHGGPDDLTTEQEKTIEKFIEKPFGERLKHFCEIAEEKGVDTGWVSDFQTKVAEGIKWRNIICHAQWEHIGEGILRGTFFSRGCVKRGHPDVVELSTDDLIRIGKSTFDNAQLLAKTFI